LPSLVLVNRHVELIERWWHLEALEKNALHTLKLDILGPSSEARNITLGLDITSKTKVPWCLFEERIFLGFGFRSSTKGSLGYLLLSCSCFLELPGSFPFFLAFFCYSFFDLRLACSDYKPYRSKNSPMTIYKSLVVVCWQLLRLLS